MKLSTRKCDTRVPRARRLRRDMTDAERKLWSRLKGLAVGSSHFRRQATIGSYFADFACHEQRLVIEVDGGQHGEANFIKNDASRTEYLKSQGYRVLRFWNNEVLTNIDGVMSVIYQALENAPPTPSPSPPQAGGGEKSIHPTPARGARRPSPSKGG
jgi:very-short-patch-repair endonuclease